MSRWDHGDMETFRLQLASAFGDGVDPLDVLGRRWGDD